jgi:hypothetical protein
MHNKNIYITNGKIPAVQQQFLCAGAFQLLRGRAPAQFRGKIALTF